MLYCEISKLQQQEDMYRNGCISRVNFSNLYLLIGWEIKSYLANSEKFWPFGLYEGHKAKKGQKTKFWQMNQNSLIHGEN